MAVVKQAAQAANGGCCGSATGNVSADGRTLFLSATGAACAPAGLRYGTGRVQGEPPAVAVSWACVKPPSMEACHWEDWQQAESGGVGVGGAS